jgi:hypothetical protein
VSTNKDRLAALIFSLMEKGQTKRTLATSVAAAIQGDPALKDEAAALFSKHAEDYRERERIIAAYGKLDDPLPDEERQLAARRRAHTRVAMFQLYRHHGGGDLEREIERRRKAAATS